MTSLSVLLACILVFTLLYAWLTARTAAAVGSAHGRLRFGFLVLVLNILVSVVFAVIESGISSDHPVKLLVLSLFLLGMQLLISYAVIRRVFQLSAVRALAPLGAAFGLTILQLCLALLVIRPFISQSFIIPTESMEPTLPIGQRFVVNKLVRPRRFDLVAYWSPGMQPAGSPLSVYCKRVIGLPGERLRFEDEKLFINDKAVELPPVLLGRCHASPHGTSWRNARYHDGDTIVLGESEFFTIGDNADISVDSRMLGPSPMSSLVGVVDLLYWPPSSFRILR